MKSLAVAAGAGAPMQMSKLLILVAAVLLTACGGGGTPPGDGEPPPVTPPVEPPAATFNMDAAYAAALSGGVGSALMPEEGGWGRRAAVSYQPTTEAAFLGQTLKRSLRRVSIVQAPSAAPGLFSAWTISYSLAPTRIAGLSDLQGNLTRYIPLGNLPTAASVGQSGPYARALTYSGPTEQTLKSEQRVSWSVEADTATTAWACLTFANSDGGVPEKECLRIDRAGAVSGFRIQELWGNVTLVTYQGVGLATSQPLSYTLLDGGRSGIQTLTFSLITDAAAWCSYWYDQHASGPLLPVDFSSQMVAAMAVGPRPNGCWGVSVASVDDWPDRIAVRFRETVSTQACTQAVVYPAVLLALPAMRKTVQWVPVAGSEALPGDHALSAQVSASYDLPATGSCRRLRFVATLPADPGATAADLSIASVSLLDASGLVRASTWDSLQVGVASGSWRVEGAGCPTEPVPHEAVWPLFRLKLKGLAHEFFAPAVTPVDTATLPFQMIGGQNIGAISEAQFFTMKSPTELASFWAGHLAPPVPPVDFSTSLAAAVLLPEGDDCHRVEIDAVVEWPDRIEVQYRNGWIPGIACAAVYVPGGPAGVFTLPLTSKPFAWLRVP